MTLRGAALGAAALLSGCVYYNAIYNAEHLFREAERNRVFGLDSLAVAQYADVVDKAARGYRMEPEGEWADDALSLLGRAHLRAGNVRAARAALDDALARTPTRQDSLAIRVFLAAAAAEAGETEVALGLLDESLRELVPGPAMAEGHYWRGRLLLAGGQEDGGWWDLDRAAALDPLVAVPAALERVAAAIRYNRPARAREGVARLFAHPAGGARRDTLAILMDRAAARWGAEGAAAVFQGSDGAEWGPTDRGLARIDRARLLHEAGDTAAALREVRGVARGAGIAAAEARLQLARWALQDVRDLVSARSVVAILLPAADHPEVDDLLADLRRLAELADVGLDRPLAWFAAAEIARERLGAPVLARGLFLAYADAAPEDPWAVKALLAALDASPAEGDRAWLRGRLEGREESPYVLAARGAPAPGFEELEEALAERLEDLRSR